MVLFGDRLTEACNKTQSYVCIGLDPRWEQIPDHIKRRAARCYGKWKTDADVHPEARRDAYIDFNTLIIEANAGKAPVVKPQRAFYEFGQNGEGDQAFFTVCNHAKANGFLVDEDAKRNDIFATAEAYAAFHLGHDCIDVMTVNSYLGFDGVKPFLAYAGEDKGKGIFLLVRTSNPSAGDFQDEISVLRDNERDLIAERLEKAGLASLYDCSPVFAREGEVLKGDTKLEKDTFGRTFVDAHSDVAVAPNYVRMALLADRWGEESIGESGWSSVGAVVGATWPKEGQILRALMPYTIFLIPGYGKQGGKAEDIPLFAGDLDSPGGILVNSSRQVNFAYKEKKWEDKFKPTDFHHASAAEVDDMNEQINGALQKAGKLAWVA
ncbi:MAG: orotidine-5'-phosphate decarboxylase [Candidatus Aenigmarchaeota archaeon]